jgi:hypothetical protein
MAYAPDIRIALNVFLGDNLSIFPATNQNRGGSYKVDDVPFIALKFHVLH